MAESKYGPGVRHHHGAAMAAPFEIIIAGETEQYAEQAAQEAFAGKYKPVGIKGKELHKPLNRCFWLAIGMYAHGKSRLIQTNSKALILNLDDHVALGSDGHVRLPVAANTSVTASGVSVSGSPTMTILPASCSSALANPNVTSRGTQCCSGIC